MRRSNMARRQNIFVFAILTALALACIVSLGNVNVQAQPEGDCIITINKAASPAENTEFNFSITGDLEDSFTLADPSSPSESFGIDVNQTVTVTEDAIAGWSLTGIECTEGVTNCGSDGFEPCLTATVEGNSVTFFCEDNDTASCTFTNTFGVSNIPTLSEWGLISLVVLLAIAGVILLRRRQTTA